MAAVDWRAGRPAPVPTSGSGHEPGRPAPRPARLPGPSTRRLAVDALIGSRGGRPGQRRRRPNCSPPASWTSRDRALVTELVYGTCRMQRACDWLAGRHTRGRLDPQVRAALRVGAYQLGWTRIPPHAAVSATVDVVRGPGRLGGQRRPAPGRQPSWPPARSPGRIPPPS